MSDGKRRTLMRVVFPDDADIDLLPLYVDVDRSGFAAPNPSESQPTHISVGTQNPSNVLGRRSVVVPEGERMSTATYFNAFPASYWRRWTTVERVDLDVTVAGEGRVMVYRSTADGRIQRVDSVEVAGEGQVTLSFELPLTVFGDGGWYWFDLVSGQEEIILLEAEYSTRVPHSSLGSATLAVTTFNRPDFCVSLLGQIAASAEALEVVDEVIVVDQGDKKVAERDEFGPVAESLGGRLRIIDQANLGGAGGFSRGMLEALDSGRSDYILLLDDDIVLEPEAVVRSIAFADLCRVPTVVGGHMLSLYSRSSLHSFGEVINRWRFWWGPHDDVQPNHDFAANSLRATPWLHRRIDVDYNGWWMCLIPLTVVRDVGLALPVFIKWDDAEFGLRAADSGYPTVSLPGMAVWHVPWTDKDDALDWQAYFHERNRFVAALLHSPYERGGRLVLESLSNQVKHVLALQYSTAELRLQALESVLEGPHHLHRELPVRLAQIRGFRSGFPDALTRPKPDAFPEPRRRKPPRWGREPSEPTTRASVVLAAAAGVVKQIRPVKQTALTAPEARVPARDARWWRLSGLDSAVVSTLDGSGVSWYQRDRERAEEILRRSVALHQRILADWRDLAAAYREAAPSFVGVEAWRDTFELD